MSIRGVLETLIYMDSFRNIDMHRQGLFYIQISCIFANEALNPMLIEHSPPMTPTRHPHNVCSPSIIDKSQSFASRVFYIRYAEEAVLLSESCSFRLDIALDKHLPLEIRAELYYSDTLTELREIHHASIEYEDFYLVNATHLILSNAMDSTNQFLPIVFKENYASVLNCTIHSMIIDFKFEDSSIPDLFPHTQEPNTADVEEISRKCAGLLHNTHKQLRRLIKLALKYGDDEEKKILPEKLKLPICKESTVCSPGNFAKHFVSKAMFDEIREIASSVCEIRYLLSSVLLHAPALMVHALKDTFNKRNLEKWSNYTFSENKSLCMLETTDPEVENRHLQESKIIRSGLPEKTFYGPLVEDSSFFYSSESNPLIFEEIFSPDRWQYRGNSEIPHLFILVHGFMGRPSCMKTIRDSISLHNKNASFLLSKSNENLTTGSILDMGNRLSSEVIAFIHDTGLTEFRLSFVGFSLGGVIIRAALPFLHMYQDKMNTLVTLSSPHLGCTNGKSKLVDAGRWFMMKVKKSLCLKQLSFNDHANFNLSCMNKLSHSGGVEWFKYLLLIGSSQDKIVPFYSARIQPWNNITQQMAECILSRLENMNVIRVDVNYGSDGKKFEKIIGKTAHLKVLECRALHSLLLCRYAFAFD